MTTLLEFAEWLAGGTIVVVDPDSAPATRPLAQDVLPVAIGCALPAVHDERGLVVAKGGAPRASANALVVALPASAVPPLGAQDAAGDGERLAESVCFFAKEAGPDTLLAALLVLARRAGIAGAAVALAAWRADADAWDAGRMPPAPAASWAALSSVHVHAVYTGPDRGGPEPLQAAWQAGMAWLLETIVAGLSPAALPAALPNQGRLALAALRRLEAVYLDCLQHAQILQLSVPMRGYPHRRTVVDTLVCVEHEFTDALKVFGRGDRAHAPGGRGFGLVLTCRPAAPPWNRFTAHADPDLQLDLRPLWHALEQAETAKRLTDGRIDRSMGCDVRDARIEAARARVRFAVPRAAWQRASVGGARLRVRRLGVVAHPWADPWYIDPACSLVASPGKFDPGPAPGTRLDWSQVQAILWACFRPLRGVCVRSLQQGDGSRPQDWGPALPILESPALAGTEGPLASPCPLRIVRWPHDTGSADGTTPGALTIDLSTTALAMLAALASRPAPLPAIELHGLPPPAQWAHIHLEGGFAVVGRRGCILVDDWRDIAVDTPAVLRAMQAARRLALAADAHAEAYRGHNARLKEVGRGRGPFDRGLNDLLVAVADERAAVAANDIDAEVLGLADPNAITLFRELVSRWRAAERLDAIEKGLAQLEQSLRAQLEARSGLALKVIGMVGLPLAVAGMAAKPIVAALNTALLAAGARVGWSDDVAAGLKDAAELPVALFCAGLFYWLLRRWVARQARPEGRVPPAQ